MRNSSHTDEIMIGLELEESLGIFCNIALHSRLQQVPDLLGSFQQISFFFFLCLAPCVSALFTWEGFLGCCRGTVLQPDPLPAHPAGNSQEFSLFQLQVGAGGE